MVVNAAGVWAPRVAAMVGIALPITPRRGQWLRTVPDGSPTVHRPILEAAYLLAKFDPAFGEQSPDPFLRMGGALTLMPRSDGGTFVGNSREFAGFDTTPDPAMTEAILRHAAAFMPSLAETPIAMRGAGLRPYTPDGLPILGPVEGIEGFVMAAGHEGDGVALSAITGRLIADFITTGARDDLAPSCPRALRGLLSALCVPVARIDILAGERDVRVAGGIGLGEERLIDADPLVRETVRRPRHVDAPDAVRLLAHLVVSPPPRAPRGGGSSGAASSRNARAGSPHRAPPSLPAPPGRAPR